MSPPALLMGARHRSSQGHGMLLAADGVKCSSEPKLGGADEHWLHSAGLAQGACRRRLFSRVRWDAPEIIPCGQDITARRLCGECSWAQDLPARKEDALHCCEGHNALCETLAAAGMTVSWSALGELCTLSALVSTREAGAMLHKTLCLLKSKNIDSYRTAQVALPANPGSWHSPTL